MNQFILFAIINLVMVILLAPLYISIIKKIKAFFQGRPGPSIFQTYRNLFKLFKKETLYSSNSSFIMCISPYLDLICSLLLALFVPLAFIPNTIFTFGNIILFLYILMITKFFIALSGLDAGSTFGGMGSSREMSVSAIVEPIIIVVFTAIALSYNSLNFFEIFNAASISQNHFFSWLLFIPLVIIFLTESARIPVDNPETHLELTMIHEAMILEQSGKNLALIEISSAIKQLLFMGIIINIFFPLGITMSTTAIAIIIAIVAFILKSVLFAVGIGALESYVAKVRFFRLPNLYAVSFFFSFVTIMLEVIL